MYRSLISVLVLIAVSSACQAQTAPPVSVVQVLVLDYKTGRPLKGREVEVMLPDARGYIYNSSPRIFKKTDRNGIAAFTIPSPLPPDVWVMADFPCTRQQAF